MSFIVKHDGVTCVLQSGREGFAFEDTALVYARSHSANTFPGEAVTVHDGDAATEQNVVAVFRDGVKVGPTHEDKGY